MEDKPVYLTMPLDRDLRNRIKSAAALKGMTIPKYVLQAVEAQMEKA